MRKPWHKRLGRVLSPKPLLTKTFNFIEGSSPALTNFLRYHGHAHEYEEQDFRYTISRPLKVTDDLYFDEYCKVEKLEPIKAARELRDVDIPIHTVLWNDAVIHGNIKAPIDRQSGLAIGFEFHNGLLAWGDVYPYPFRRTNCVQGDVIFIPKIKNIFHLLVEHILPILAAIIRRPNDFDRKITFISQINYPLIDCLSEFLNSRGFVSKVFYISPGDEIQIDRLISSRAKARDSSFNYAYYEELKELFPYFDELTRHIDVPEFVYVTRSRTPRRNIYNQNDLIDALAKQNVSSVNFHFGNILEQIAIFRRSRLIISAHGAALANLAFSGSRQALLEIFASNWRQACYVNMASQHGVRYHAMFGSRESGNGHFTIPIEEAVAFINRFRSS